MGTTMEQYILPLFCLLLNFVAMAACLRFLLSREGKYWIMPFLLSFLLFLQNGSVLYAGSRLATIALYAGGLVNTLISILWYAIIVIFHYALKKTTHASNYRLRVRKDLAESQFLLKSQAIARQRRLRKLKVLAQGSAKEFRRDVYTSEWTDLFDQF